MLEEILVIGIVLFLALMAYQGSRKGFIRLIYSAVALIVVMLLSRCLSVPVEDFLEKNTHIYDMVKEQTDRYVAENIKGNIENSTEHIREDILESLKLPKPVADSLSKNYLKNETESDTDEFCACVSGGLASLCMDAMVTVILFLLIWGILEVVSEVFDVFARLPVINEINRLAGAAAGVAKGILILWVLCILLMAMTGTPSGNMIMDAVDSNAFLRFIYNTNVFAKLLGNIIS